MAVPSLEPAYAVLGDRPKGHREDSTVQNASDLGLENQKASPAQTLRAYRFFSEERLQGRYNAYFITAELICVLLFVFLPQPDSGIEDVDGSFFCLRDIAAVLGACIAGRRIRALVKRHYRLMQIRLSIWEQELNAYSTKRSLLFAAMASACIAFAGWVAVIVVRLL